MVQKRKRLNKKITHKGQGLFDTIKNAFNSGNKKIKEIKNKAIDFVAPRVVAALKGKREGLTGRFQDYLNNEKDNEIIDIKINETPVYGTIQKALNTISLGGFNKAKKKLGIEDAYHRYALVTTKDGVTKRLEKNHVIEAKPAKPSDFIGARDIPLKGRKITPKELIANASKKDDEFYDYCPSEKNCQYFVKDLVEGNDLKTGLDGKTKSIVEPQDTKALIDSLGVLKDVPKKITDLAAYADHVAFGRGVVTRLGYNPFEFN